MISIVLALSLAVAGQDHAGPCSNAESASAGTADAKACDSAIAEASTPKAQANLITERAYLRNENKDSLGALTDLDRALAIDPDNAFSLTERAYTRNELADYRGALDDIDHKVRLGIDTVDVYKERAFSRAFIGDFAGAVADRDHVLKLIPDNSEAWSARAIDLMWMGRLDDARSDIDHATTLANAQADSATLKNLADLRRQITLMTSDAEASPDKVCRAAQKSGEFGRKGLIATCTAAYIAAPTNAAKAEFLTTRAVAWMFSDHDVQMTSDRQRAVALDPGNADWHANLGFSYTQNRHSWAGEREFDKALAINESWAAYGGRAMARYNLKKVDGAFADARKSLEIKPNEIALTVLGDLSFDRDDAKGARLYWLSAYRMGDNGEDMLERLKKIGITDPAKEAASK